MNALERVVEDMNFWPRITKNFDQMVKFPVVKRDIPKIRQHIECALSPENLHCDGEASPQFVRQQYAKLMTAWDLLADMDGNTAEPYV